MFSFLVFAFNAFTYRAREPFTKNKETIQKFKETGDSRYIYQSELDKACFQHAWLMEILKIYPEEQLRIKYMLFNICYKAI